MKRYIVRVTQSIKRQNTVIKRKALIPLKLGLLAVKRGLAQESRETKVMLITYKRFTRGQASKLEMQQANQQFVDVIRGLGLGVLAILPFAPITLPFVVKLGEKIGVNVLPSAFMKDLQEDDVIEVRQQIEVVVDTENDTNVTHNKQ
nr:hypothetical protein [Paraglaciecola arctica]